MDFYGLDDFRLKLEELGYRSYPDHLKSDMNDCNWIACKRVQEPCRECETNERKVQYVIHPYHFTIHSNTHRSYTLEIVGEHAGVWYKLEAYGLDVDTLSNINEVESKLLKAWNALGEQI